MTGAQFLVAKYVPDLIRNEPRNIGVIVWSEAGVEARFQGADKYGNFTSKNIPNFIQSPPAYKQWVKFWLSEVQKDKIEFIGAGKFAEKVSPDFVEALQTTGKGNYFLDKGGAVLETITEEKLPKLVDELFMTLVNVTPESTDEKYSTEFLEIQCEEVIQKTRLVKNKFFKKEGMTIQCPLATEVTEIIAFSYAIRNGAPVWLGQQVPLRKYPIERDRIIESAAWRFQAAIKYEFVKNKDRLAAFVCPTDAQMRDREVQKGLAILATQARVLNLSNREEAQAALDEIADIPVAEH